MDGSGSENRYKPRKGNTLEQVKTHFGSLETERVPMVISLEGLPEADEYKKVVDSFYDNLKSSHPYQYQDIIGEGGMGLVEKVKDKKCLRSIAKKTLNPANYDKESIIRFTEEAQITAQLEHPNIVPVYEMGLDDKNRLFYTMKLVKGRNLKEILRLIKNKDEEIIRKFPLSNLLEIFTAVCDAMSYACSRKIVHRDLKPDNIMVGDYGEVYIVDWGLAKIIKNDSTISTEEIPEWIVKEVYDKKDVSTDKFLKELRKIDSLRTKDKDLNISFNDILIGTPQYMAPERISGEADECSEVYALGAILYNILTLELTVKGDNLEEIVTKIFNEDIKSPLKFSNLPHLPGGKVPPSLAAVAMKALSAEPIDRYHKVSQLRNEISAWEDGYITEAEKAGPWVILWSNLKRHKIESAIFLIFTGLLIIIYTVYAINLKEDKLKAEKSEKIALTQKLLAEKETKNISDQSKEILNKISALEKLAPGLSDRSQYYLKNNQLMKALSTIKDAIKLKPEAEYYIQCGNIQQTLNRFSDSITSYKSALQLQPDSQTVKNAINFSQKHRESTLDSYVDLLNYRKFLTSQKRLIEAGIVSRKLLNRTTNIRLKILKKLSNTHLKSVKGKQLTIDNEGGLSLNISNMNIEDISPLAGMPFKSLNLSNNPIADIDVLKGMPLEILNLASTNVNSLKPLRGAPLRVLTVRNTPVKFLDGLNLSPLNTLDVSNTSIKSLTGANTKYLKVLDLSSTSVVSLSGSNLKSLRDLNINETKIDSLESVRTSQLTTLYMKETAITDLTPLEKSFLNTLDVSHCSIDNFDAIKNQPLENLKAEYSNLSDLSFLTGKKLTSFSAEGTAVSNLKPLEGMPLRKLNLSKTSLSNLESIEQLPLEELSLIQCKISELPALNNLSNKASVWLRGSEIENFSVLSRRNFRLLDLAQSKVKSLESFKDCTFEHLDISNTAITDLSPLKGKTIDFLNIDDCRITDLTPLSECLLEKLSMSRLPITDLSPLAGIPLTELYARDLKISKVDFINKSSIKQLDLSSSQISDLSFLKDSDIYFLNLSYTKVKDLQILKSCSNLQILDLYGTPIESIEDLQSIKLKDLIIGNCSKVKNLNPVKKMKSLRKLIFPGHISDIEFLREFKNLKILGTTSAHHGQNVEVFWKKYDRKVKDEQ
ncbi:MAG: protein kinase [Lentisphaeraceae bacterium]|nr:protein kinase [Lentisphaeraceae bacterium]